MTASGLSTKDGPVLDDDVRLSQNTGVDYGALPEQPSPEDYFLMSRVRGEVTVAQLCAASGLGRDKALSTIERLISFGMLDAVDGSGKPIVIASQSAAAERERPAPEPANEGAMLDDEPEINAGAMLDDEPANAGAMLDDEPEANAGAMLDDEPANAGAMLDEPKNDAASTAAVNQKAVEVKRAERQRARSEAKKRDRAKGGSDGFIAYPRMPVPFDDFVPPHEWMALNVEIEDVLKAEILYVHSLMDQVDYYQLLGVEEDADRRDIKKRYVALSKRFHPDNFFRKETGDYKQLIENVFKRLNSAQGTLTRKNKRDEYDRALAAYHAGGGGSLSEASGVSEATNEPPPSTVIDDAPPAESGPRPKLDKRAAAHKILLKRGEAQADRGEYMKAATQFSKALAVQKDNATMLRIVEMHILAAEKLDKAALVARAAIRDEPADAKAHLALARVHEAAGDLERAANALEEALDSVEDKSAIEEALEKLKSGKKLNES